MVYHQAKYLEYDFLTFIWTTFIFLRNIGTCNFDDKTTRFVCDKALETVLETREKNLKIAILWVENNYIKLNTPNHMTKYWKTFANLWIKKTIFWAANNYMKLNRPKHLIKYWKMFADLLSKIRIYEGKIWKSSDIETLNVILLVFAWNLNKREV